MMNHLQKEYKIIKNNKNIEMSNLCMSDDLRYYKIKIKTNMTKTQLIRSIKNIENHKTNNFLLEVKKSDIKNVYVYRIFNEYLNNINNKDFECHLELKQINNNNFLITSFRHSKNYFENTCYFNISFIDIYIKNNEDNNKEDNKNLIIYFKFEKSLHICELSDDDFWIQIEKLIINFSNLFIE